MSEPRAAVEGQGLARSIVEALDAAGRPDWDALQRAYGEALLRQADRSRRNLELQRNLTAEDLLHDFLAEKIYPPRKAEGMFGPSARGERPLLGRLLTSLGNYCKDRARNRPGKRERGEQEGQLANAPTPIPEQLPTYDEVKRVLHRRMTAIREACPLRLRPGGAAYREALFIRLRLDCAGGFDGVEVRALGREVVVLDLPLLEQLTPWTDEERTMPLVEEGISLAELWERLRGIVEIDHPRPVSVEHLAQLIPTSRDQWNQWISRGKHLLQTQLKADYDRVFPA